MKSNMGKQIKDVGSLFFFVCAILAMAVLFIFVAGDSSPLGRFINDKFFFITVGGLLCFLIGIIVRSIGKTKEAKENEQK